MGHERVGLLPTSDKWRNIVEDIGNFSLSDPTVTDIAGRTLQRVTKRFRRIHRDENVIQSFQFLVTLSVAFKSPESRPHLTNSNLELPTKITPLTLAKIFQKWMDEGEGSLEYREIARQATLDAVARWYREHKPASESLFDESNHNLETWRKLASTAGFCELARLYFAKFTERYLNYFLEREASSVLALEDRREFHKRIEQHLEDISKHTFEQAKITQSFAAGWYENHVREEVPSEDEIANFLSVAFGKMCEELQRDIDNNGTKN